LAEGNAATILTSSRMISIALLVILAAYLSQNCPLRNLQRCLPDRSRIGILHRNLDNLRVKSKTTTTSTFFQKILIALWILMIHSHPIPPPQRGDDYPLPGQLQLEARGSKPKEVEDNHCTRFGPDSLHKFARSICRYCETTKAEGEGDRRYSG